MLRLLRLGGPAAAIQGLLTALAIQHMGSAVPGPAAGPAKIQLRTSQACLPGPCPFGNRCLTLGFCHRQPSAALLYTLRRTGDSGC